MPVLACRITVALDVSNYFGVDLTSGIKAKRCFYLSVFKVTVNGFRTANYLHTGINGFVIFGQHACVGVGIVSSDDNQRTDVEFLQNLQSFVKLLFLLELCTSRTDNIKTARVAVLVDNIGSKFFIFVVYQSCRTQDKPIKPAIRVQPFDPVENSGNHVVPAGSLSSG
ncbi:hypothetical protein SDC9_141695 [bioreactor metagenome]|uniref:Uncharacterized protein n=1 Tax=bioreactor metagenome TaxID=1076179 RepID=A0A645DZ51_9ZZZZ